MRRWQAAGLALVLMATGARAEDRKHGTAIEWEASPAAAAERAKAEHRLVLVLHLAGEFEKSEFT